MKKILALVLALLMLLQLPSAFAEDNSEEFVLSTHMKFAVATGIMDADTNPAGAVSRIELAKIFYNIMMPGSQIVMDYSSFFTDVDFSSAAYADFAYRCKIMNGVGGGLFEPEANVTYAQLIKTVVSFLGYSPLAESKGGYPHGYMAVASNLNLTDDMPPSVDSIVTADKVASVLRIATNAELMEVITYQDDYAEYGITKGSDYLETYMGITRVRGIINANCYTDINGEMPTSHGKVKVGDMLFSLTDASAGIENYLGYEADVYVKKERNNSSEAIIYYEISDTNNVLAIQNENIKVLTGFNLGYFDNDNEKYAKISSGTKLVYNGIYISGYDEHHVNPFEGSKLEGSITLIDNNNDRIYDVINVDAYSSYVVKNIADDTIFNEYYPSEIIDLGSDFNDGDIEILNILGQRILLSEIEQGDIINVSKDINGKVTKIVVTIDTLTGTINEIDSSNSKITLDGNVYKLSKNFVNNPNSDYANIKPGNEITLYFNKDGKVSDIKLTAKKHKTGYLVDAAPTSGMDSEWMLRIFTASGEFEEFAIADKVEVKGYGKLNPQNAVNKAYQSVEKGGITSQNGKVVRQVVLYRTNSEGKINWIDYATSTIRDGLYVMDGYDGSNPQTVYYCSSQKSFGGELLINENTVIFNVPAESDAENWSNYFVETTSYYSQGDRKTDFIAYSTNDKGSPCAQILVEYDGKKNVSSSADLFVISQITNVVNEDGDEKLKLVGYLNGSLKTYYGEKSDIENCLYGDTLETGDIIKLRVIDGEVKKITKVFDCVDRKFLKAAKNSSGEYEYVETTNPTDPEFDANGRCSYGEVIFKDDNFIKIKLDGSETIQAYPLSTFKFVEVDMTNVRNRTVQASSALHVFDSQNYPGYQSKVVVHTLKGVARSFVIYKGMEGGQQ